MLRQFKNIYYISYYTFLEFFKAKFFYVSLACGLIVFFISFMTSEFSYGNPQRVAIDFSIGLNHLLNVIFALFLGGSLFREEIENKTIHLLLSSNFHRSQVFTGKVFGLFLVLLLNTLIILFLGQGVYFILGGKFSTLIHLSYFFNFFESIIVMLISVFFSLFLSTILCVASTTVFIYASYNYYLILDSHLLKNNYFLKQIFTGLDYLIPNFYLNNLKDFILRENHFDKSVCYYLLIHYILYFILYYFLSLLLFKKRDL